MRLTAAAAAAALALAGLTGCGESSQVTVYKQGRYQGKPDSRPWDGEAFKGDRANWEKTIKARNNGQNEYTRTVSN